MTTPVSAKIPHLGRALTEFGVIVAGVLVALAADGWREDWQERDAESSYVARLRQDLTRDTAALNQGQRNLVGNEEALLRLSRLPAQDESYDEDDLAADLAAATYWTWNWIDASSVTFDEMRSSGQLGLIRDSTLREAVSAYYARHENAASTVDARRPAFNELTYRLVPRHEASVRGFDARSGALSTHQRERLASPSLLDQIAQEATAQLNYSRHYVNQARDLVDRATRLLKRLDTYQHR